jgi:hypothetical protein
MARRPTAPSDSRHHRPAREGRLMLRYDDAEYDGVASAASRVGMT